MIGGISIWCANNYETQGGIINVGKGVIKLYSIILTTLSIV